MAGYLPNTEGDLVTWLKNYIVKIGTYGASLGMSAEEIAEQQRLAQLLIDEIANANAAEAARKKATEDKNAQKTSSLKSIRDNVSRIKTSPNCTDAINKDMQTGSSLVNFEPATYKAKLKLSVAGGRVIIAFIKAGVEGLNIYTRMKGETEWKFLGHATRTPYTDPRPLAKAGVAEIREYMAMGEYKDQEIGQASDVASISFGG